MNLLFLCTANICRSPVAEFFMRHLMQRLGATGISVYSSGTQASAGFPADPIAARLAAERGVDVSPHRSHPLTKEDLFRADEIVVMERRHRGYIREHYPEFSTKVTLLLQEGGKARDLPDPTGGTLALYRRVFDELFEAVERRTLDLKYPV